MTKLSARIPSGENDGFAPISQKLLTGNGTHLMIAEVDAPKVLTDKEKNTSEATVRIVAFEVVLPGDVKSAAEIMRNARKERTGEYDLFDTDGTVVPIRPAADDDVVDAEIEDDAADDDDDDTWDDDDDDTEDQS